MMKYLDLANNLLYIQLSAAARCHHAGAATGDEGREGRGTHGGLRQATRDDHLQLRRAGWRQRRRAGCRAGDRVVEGASAREGARDHQHVRHESAGRGGDADGKPAPPTTRAHVHA
eukprot:3190025-Pleurochrysis_carterae.AAC.1